MKKILFIAMILSLGFVAQAQKIGYVNSQAIVAELPQVKEANANIDALKKQLGKKGQQMIEGLQAKYVELQQKQQKGDISPVQLEQEAAVLKKEEESIAKFEQSSQEKLMKKSQELLAPIQEKINTAIQDVAKEEGYDYIFDASMGSILYAAPSTDLADKIKSKLGI